MVPFRPLLMPLAGIYFLAENKTSGYILIHAEGGLNQQRIAICNAVAVAKILNAALILPVLKQDSIWKDQTKFEDIFDVDHFIEYLKDDVRIVRDIPDWFTPKTFLFDNIRWTVKNIPKFAPAQFYIDNVLPRIKEKKVMAIKPFVDRLGYDNVPPEINRLRCRVNYHALKFLPEIEEMSDKLVARMRNRTGTLNPYMALHLRSEKGMVGLSFCDFVGTREEKETMAEFRKKEWPRRYKDGSHLWQLALQKRKAGRCPLEPGEVAAILRAMGYPEETQIYVASGQVYGGKNRMAPLRNLFPNLVTKEDLASQEELEQFRRHVTSLAALDFLVCLKSDVFVMTHGGNFAKLIIGARRYMGHRLKSIKPDKGLVSKYFGDPYKGWPTLSRTCRSRTIPGPVFLRRPSLTMISGRILLLLACAELKQCGKWFTVFNKTVNHSPSLVQIPTLRKSFQVHIYVVLDKTVNRSPSSRGHRNGGKRAERENGGKENFATKGGDGSPPSKRR
uniref:O-fucosyltransferase family protein n=1 Tax=Ananas comosus var. bracteatus TaxID=296719 RepID=A0A6V7P2B2_ANACO|nr:unnamed protein product [Ananas comosus var. bracteatus]